MTPKGDRGFGRRRWSDNMNPEVFQLAIAKGVFVINQDTGFTCDRVYKVLKRTWT